jgi:hypothetical protein
MRLPNNFVQATSLYALLLFLSRWRGVAAADPYTSDL